MRYFFYTITIFIFLLFIDANNNKVVSQCSNFTIEAGSDVEICAGSNTQLNVTGGTVYSWSPASGLSNTSISNPVASPSVTTTYYVSSSLLGVNVINNGGFEQGNTAFSSSYSYQTNLYPEGTYYTATNPHDYHAGFSSCSDHTSGTGNMMIINGSGTPGTNVWCQTISISANTNYEFATWATSVHPSSPAILQFSINGQVLGSPFSLSSSTCSWNQFFSTWNSGSNTSANICIVNQNTATGGNDFALDDIYFSPICTCTDSVIVTVNPIPTPDAGLPETICSGQNITLTATGGSSYQWNNGESTASIIVSPTITTTYIVTVSNGSCSDTDDIIITVNTSPTVSISATANPICSGDSTTLTATGGTTYSWSPSVGLSSSNISNPIAIPSSTTTYTVTVSDNSGCYSTDNITVTVYPQIIANAGPDQSICKEQEVAGITATGGTNYSWSPSTGLTNTNISNPFASPLTTTTYTVTISDVYGCSKTDDITIFVNPVPSLIYVTDSANCNSSDGSITLTASGGSPPYSYIWNPSVSTTDIADNIPAGSYKVTITDNSGCTATSAILVGETSVPIITISSNNEVCGQANGNAEATVTGGSGIYSYLWSNGANTSIATGLSANAYTVTVTDNNGCFGTASVNITGVPGPNAGFSAHPKVLTIIDGAIVTFTDNSSGNIIDWQWNFGDGSPNGSGTELFHSYNDVGTYVVTLIVTDNNGCTDSATDTIKVKDLFTFYAPNAFTPNGDELDDYFFAQGKNWDSDNFEMYIFDRFGNMVYQTKTVGDKWNGTLNNSGVQDEAITDVYVYIIRVKELEGKVHEFIGKITLVK